MTRQRGSALLLILLLLGVVGAFFAVRTLNEVAIERDKVTAAALAQAKDALIGYAVSYRDTHAGEVNGHLPLPDLGSNVNTFADEGRTAGNFAGNAVNLSALGRLPWRTLGIAPLRDSKGECLWLAVAGSFQEAQKSPYMNWDTLGHWDTFQSDGTAAGTVSNLASAHQRPAAAVFSPADVLPGQVRAPAGAALVTECGGNYAARNYLDTFNAQPQLNNIVNYLGGANNATGNYAAAPKPLLMGPVFDPASRAPLVNDRMLTITPEEIFQAVKRRNDFAAFVGTLLSAATTNLAILPVPDTWNFTNPVPTRAPSVISVGSLTIGRVPQSALVGGMGTALQRWGDNLLYARCNSGGSCLLVNGASCAGVVIFAGERTKAPVAQTRVTNAEKNTWSNYLEGDVLTKFTTGATTFNGPTAYSAAASSADVLACVTPTPSAPTEVSFSANFGSFVSTGAGVSTNPATPSVTLALAGGASGGCFWSPIAIPLAGRTVRAYYEFTFTDPDTHALIRRGSDRGNGFTLSFVRGDLETTPTTTPPTYAPPNTCGAQSDMGALGAADTWGGSSFFVETDVYSNSIDSDPVENHTAIMLNGNIGHTGASDTMSAACNGSATGCQHAPANKFEENPPLPHNQRIEIHTGCNATCGTCNPSAHVAPNTYARITAWSSCASCSNVAADLNRVTQPPTVQRCLDLGTGMYPDGDMNSVFFGFTGGFRSGRSSQGVTLKNLFLRSE